MLQSSKNQKTIGEGSLKDGLFNPDQEKRLAEFLRVAYAPKNKVLKFMWPVVVLTCLRLLDNFVLDYLPERVKLLLKDAFSDFDSGL